MRKKVLSSAVALLSLTLSMNGQSSILHSYRERCDSLSTLLEEHTSVKNKIKISSVKNQNGTLNFYFNTSIGDYPWRKDDIQWFKKVLEDIAPDNCRHYKIGSIYCDGMPLAQLVTDNAGNDGSPHENRWSIADPRQANKHPLVKEIGGQYFHKGLSDRYIALWHSHGRYFDAKDRRWKWQRAPLFSTVEDMYTQSYVLPFLIPMLENAGAYILSPRERDIQKNESICDNDAAFTSPREGYVRKLGDYKETGKWSNAGVGFADLKEAYIDNDNPFTMGTVRQAICSEEKHGDAKAVWTPDIPERGRYSVYISYKSLPNSSETAHYTVRHLGGESHFLVNQRMGGGTWVYLGTFEFESGKDFSVTLDNGTVENNSFKPGTIVTADAVRFGGGMGKIARGDKTSGYELSGMPSFAEGALYWMQWAGADSTITRRFEDDYTNDYADRGAWTAMMSGGSRVNPAEQGKRIPVDLSFAFHTDAGVTPNDSTIGTLAIYTLKCEGSRKLPDGEDRMTARILTDDVQTQIVNDIRSQFEPEWRRRQIWNRSYSESRTSGVPGMLLELLSHQNFADMKYGLDPAFRFTVSRAVYKGILKYLSSRYNCHYEVQPLPVNSFSATLSGNDKVILSWRPTIDTLEATANPTGYLLYTKIDNGGFDKGRIIKPVKKSDGFLSLESNIEKGHLYSYQIVAFNDGGKSFPSETMSAGIPAYGCPENRTVLVVNNFYRTAAPAWFDTPAYAGFDNRLDGGIAYQYDICNIGEMYQWRRDQEWTSDDNPGFGASYTDNAGKVMPGNTFNYTEIHGRALLSAGYSFCSASADAFGADSTVFRKFRTADIICGKQITTPTGRGGTLPNRFQVFPEKFRKAVTSYCRKGGNVIVSGANIGTDLWDKIYPVAVDSAYQENSRKFATEILGFKWLTNYAERLGEVRAVHQKDIRLDSFKKPFAFYQLPNRVMYHVETPDGLLPASKEAAVFLRYNATNIPAGICNNGNGYRSVSIGFPLETIKDETELAALMKAIMDFFIK